MAGFNPLAMLFGQEAASILAGTNPEQLPPVDPMASAPPDFQPTDPSWDAANGISVTGQLPTERDVSRPPSYETPEERPVITPRYILNDDRQAPDPSEMKEILPRKGMFGTKGTLRDVLGVLGDAFLVQGGEKAIYGPQRQREKAGDAMFGATDNPQQAAERLAAAGFTEEAQDLLKQVADQDYRNRTLASQDSNRTRDDIATSRNQVARWFNNAKTPAQVTFAYQMAQRRAQELGIPVSQLVPEDMTDEQRAVYAGGDMTVYQQGQLPLAQERVRETGRHNRVTEGQGQQNANSRSTSAAASMKNANRPRPAPQQRAQTELEYYKEVGRKPEAQRTPAERDFYKKYTQGTRGGGASRIPAAVPPPPGGRRTFTVRRTPAQ